MSSDKQIDLPDLPLHSKWTLYFHKSFDNDWSLESYTKIYTVDTVKSFWRLVNNLPKYHNYFWFFMRDNHPPMWEDPQNTGTGWIYRIPFKGDHELKLKGVNGYQPCAFNIYVNVLVSVIGEMITTDSERIIGVSISPKKGECQLRLWDTAKEKPLVFSNDFKEKTIRETKAMKNEHKVK